MTQHTEPTAWMWTDSTGCVHMAADRPDIYETAATVARFPEPLYDAAALAAAEESAEARIAELEKRLADADVFVREFAATTAREDRAAAARSYMERK